MDSYMEQHLGQLLGWTVAGLAIDDDDEFEDMFGIVFTKKGEDKKMVAWIFCDEEGNGPGHLDIEPLDEEDIKD